MLIGEQTPVDPRSNTSPRAAPRRVGRAAHEAAGEIEGDRGDERRDRGRVDVGVHGAGRGSESRASRSSTRPCGRSSSPSGPFCERHPEYGDAKILERIVEPERVIMFRVPWVDDEGEVQVNRGFRVEFNSAHRPVQGRAALPPDRQPRHPQVPRLRADLQERLTTLPMGGGKGGSDFDPKGKQRRRGHALLPGVHDRALPPHRRPTPTSRPVTSASAAARSATCSVSTSGSRTSSTGVLTGKGLQLGWQPDPPGGHRLRHGLLRRGDAQDPPGQLRRQDGLSSPARATSRSTRPRR